MAVTELGKFRVLPGKEERVTEWLAFLNQHLKTILLTLEQEKMYVEAIFREVENGETYLYWFSVQGENPLPVEASAFEVDRQHLRYWEECIDSTYGEHLLQTEVVMIPDNLKQLMID